MQRAVRCAFVCVLSWWKTPFSRHRLFRVSSTDCRRSTTKANNSREAGFGWKALHKNLCQQKVQWPDLTLGSLSLTTRHGAAAPPVGDALSVGFCKGALWNKGGGRSHTHSRGRGVRNPSAWSLLPLSPASTPGHSDEVDAGSSPPAGMPIRRSLPVLVLHMGPNLEHEIELEFAIKINLL